MALTYQNIIHGVSLRVNALVGSLPADLQTTYSKINLAAGDVESAEFPWDALIDAILMSESDRAKEIANNVDDPLRAYLHAPSGNIASRATLPIVSASGDPRIGVIGAVKDASDTKMLTPKPLSVVRRINNETWRIYPSYHYALDSNRIEHTRTSVTIDLCVYNRTTARASIGANGNSVLPESEEGWLVSRAVSYLVKDDAFMEQARMFRAYTEKAAA